MLLIFWEGLITLFPTLVTLFTADACSTCISQVFHPISSFILFFKFAVPWISRNSFVSSFSYSHFLSWDSLSQFNIGLNRHNSVDLNGSIHSQTKISLVQSVHLQHTTATKMSGALWLNEASLLEKQSVVLSHLPHCKNRQYCPVPLPLSITFSLPLHVFSPWFSLYKYPNAMIIPTFSLLSKGPWDFW